MRKETESNINEVYHNVKPHLDNERTTESYQWIPVSERVPDRNEYEASTADGQYFRRLEIATKTDTIEYHIGYYDGDVWFDKRYQSFKGDVVAWKIHQPYKQEQLHEVDWKDHMMERFGRVN